MSAANSFRKTTGFLGLAALVAVLAGLLFYGQSTAQRSKLDLDVPYVPTPQLVVDKMLEMAGVGPDDYLIDLGSGDGRIPVTAASRFGTPGFGVDIDPRRIGEAQANAAKKGVEGKVEFHQRDLFKTDISRATVLTMYLLPSVNMQLRPRILTELKPGTRIVSHSFSMGDWEPDRSVKVDGRNVHFWVVPAQIDGGWQMTETGKAGDGIALDIDQKFQKLTGSAAAEGKSMVLENATVTGDKLRFEIVNEGGRKIYEGRFANDRIQGEGWEAVRRS